MIQTDIPCSLFLLRVQQSTVTLRPCGKNKRVIILYEYLVFFTITYLCTVCPRSSDTFYKYSKLLYKMGHYLLDILYSSKLLYKMGHYFLDLQYTCVYINKRNSASNSISYFYLSYSNLRRPSNPIFLLENLQISWTVIRTCQAN